MTGFIVNFSGRLLQFFMQLVLIKLITMYLTKSEAAILFVILLIAGGVSIIFISPIGQYLNRKIIDFESEEIISFQLILFFLYTLCISPIAMTVSYLYFGIQEITVSLMVHLVSSFYFVGITLNQVTLGGLNILGRSKLFVGYSLLTQFIIISQILILNTIKLDHLMWVGSLVIANIIVGALAFHALNDGSYKIIHQHLKLGLLKNKIYDQIQEIWQFSGKILVTLVCIWIFQVGFRFELLPSIGADEFALFSVGYSLAVLIFAGCEQILNSYCLPMYYAKIHSDEDSSSTAWNWLAAIAIPTYLLALFFTITFSEILVILILDSSYQAAGFYVKFAAVLEFLRVIYSLLSLHAHGLNNTKFLVYPSLVGLFIFCFSHILINFSFIDNTLFYIVILSNSAAIYLLWRTYSKSCNPIKIIDNKAMLKLLPFVCILSIAFNYLPGNMSFSNAVIVFLGSVLICFSFWLFITWESVLEIIHKFKKGT